MEQAQSRPNESDAVPTTGVGADVHNGGSLTRIYAVPQIHCRTPLPELEFGSTQADDAPMMRFLVVVIHVAPVAKPTLGHERNARIRLPTPAAAEHHKSAVAPPEWASAVRVVQGSGAQSGREVRQGVLEQPTVADQDCRRPQLQRETRAMAQCAL